MSIERSHTLADLPTSAFYVNPSGTILDMNERCAIIFGKSPDLLVGKSIKTLADESLVGSAVPKKFATAVDRATDSGGQASFVMPVQFDAAEQATHYTANVGSPNSKDCHICLLNPLEESYANTARIVESLNGAARLMFASGSSKEVFKIVAEKASDILGFHGTSTRQYISSEEVLSIVNYGTTVGNIDRPDYSIHGTPHGEAFKTGKTVLSDITEQDDAYDRDVFTQTAYIPIGEYGILSIGKTTDKITAIERRYAEVLARNATATLEQMDHQRCLRDRDRRLEGFADVLAHDVRNALTIANGYADMLDRSEQASEKITGSLDRINEIVSDLRLFAQRGRDDHFERVDSDKLASVCNHLFHATHVGCDAVKLSLASHETVRCDPILLQRLLRAVVEEADETASEGDTPAIEVVSHTDGLSITATEPLFDQQKSDNAFSFGHGTTTEGSGFQTATVGGIAELHGWGITHDVNNGQTEIGFLVEKDSFDTP